jgi:hypothetical protein
MTVLMVAASIMAETLVYTNQLVNTNFFVQIRSAVADDSLKIVDLSK